MARVWNSNEDAGVLPPKLAAAQAALERQAVQESLRMAAAATAKTPKLPQQQQQRAARKVTPPTIDLLDDDDDDDDDKKMPAIVNPYRKVVNNNKAKKSSVILELDLDSDSDDELPESIFQKTSQGVAAKRDLQFGKQDAKRANDYDDDDVVDLTESQESTAFLPADNNAKPATKQQNKRTLEWDSDSDDDNDELPESILNKKTVRPAAAGAAAAVQRERCVAASSSANAKPAVVVQGQPQLTVYIDDRERNRNHTPRTLRLELTRLLSSGSLAMVWPKSLPQAAVEERNLKSGDFAYAVTTTHGAALNKKEETSPLPIVVERKRIGDLVQRSFRKDHWYQLQRMQAEAAARNDNGGICVLLLEGDCRTAAQYTAYGAQEVQTAPSPFDHTIDDEDTLYRFMGRAILSDRSNSTRFVQAKEEQGSLRAVGALGLMSVAQHSANSKTNGRRVDATAERTFLKDRLQKGGLPWELASRIADEIRSVQQMDALYASIDDETCRDLLFVPLLEDVCGRIKFDGTAHGWSRAVHRIWFSALSDPKVGRQRFDELLCLAEDHALLLDKLHTGLPPEEAMDELLSAQQLLKEDLPRTVSIELPKEHQSCFPSDGTDGPAKFFRLKVTNNEQQTIPVVTMQTKSGAFSSSRLFVNLLDGTEVVRRLQESFVDGNESIVVARQIALQLKQDLGSSRRVLSADDKTVLLIRGMGNALDQGAKKTGFRSEIRVLGKSWWL